MYVSDQAGEFNFQNRAKGGAVTISNASSSKQGTSASEIAAEFRLQHRQGDVVFRQRLLDAYGGMCAISGTPVAETLQVALINPASADLQDFGNALLLRADIHNLFDARLITIEPVSLTVLIAPQLNQSSYVELQGRKLRQPERHAHRLSRQLLDSHYRQFMRLWFADKQEVQGTRLGLRAVSSQQPAEPAQAVPAPPAPADAVAALQSPALDSEPHVKLTIQVKSWVNCLGFSADGHLLATGSWDGSIRLWRPYDGYLLHTMPSGMGEVNGLAFSPDKRLLATVSRNRAIQLWRAGDGTLLHTRHEGEEAHEGAVFSVCFSPNSDLVASGSWDCTVRIWRSADGSLVNVLRDHRGAVNSVAYGPGGKVLASGSHDRLVRIWRAADGMLLHTLHGHSDAVFCVAFSPDGRLLASAGSDHLIYLWRVADGSLMRVFEAHQGAVFSIAFSPDSKMLASGDYNRYIRFWRVSDGALLYNMRAHGEGITSLAFSPDGQTLASGSFDASVRLWQVSP